MQTSSTVQLIFCIKSNNVKKFNLVSVKFWKVKMVLKSLILLLVAFGYTSSQQMTCTYSIVTTNNINKYHCKLNISNPNGLDDAVSIGGVHSGSDSSYVDDYGNLISNSTFNDSSVQIVSVVGITKNIPSAICRQFPNVETLSLFNVGIQIVTATKCSKLTDLQLYYNSLEQSSLPDLCQFQPELRLLRLSSNKLKAIPDITLKSCKNLIYINADYNQISALSSTLFASTPMIQTISFGYNPISVIPSGIFNGLTELKALHLHNLNITDLPINVLSTATKLQTLVISYNKFTQYRPEWFLNLKNLFELHLDYNNAPIPANLFQPLTSLQILSLQNCSISVVNPQWFSTLTLLYQVDLQLNNISQIPDKTFANTTSLKNLRISGNKLTVISSKWFSTATLQSLSEISADNNKINAIDPLFFEQATGLWTVSLYNNTCYTGPKITDFKTKRSTYIPGFQACTGKYLSTRQPFQ